MSKGVAWVVFVYEENGNPVIMERRKSREEAEEAAQRYELRGHRAAVVTQNLIHDNARES